MLKGSVPRKFTALLRRSHTPKQVTVPGKHASMIDMRKIWIVWLAGFLAATILAPSVPIHSLDVAVSGFLEPWGRQYSVLQLIWVAGGIPLTALIVVYIASGHFGRKPAQWRILGLFVLGSIIEVVVKHFVATAFPPNVPPSGDLRHLILWTNVEPSTVLAWIRDIHGGPAATHFSSSDLFRGSFPSGHVFRITYAYGLFLASQWRLMTAAVACVCVVATGGHWIWDAVGGYLLASLCLEGARVPAIEGEVVSHG